MQHKMCIIVWHQHHCVKSRDFASLCHSHHDMTPKNFLLFSLAETNWPAMYFVETLSSLSWWMWQTMQLFKRFWDMVFLRYVLILRSAEKLLSEEADDIGTVKYKWSNAHVCWNILRRAREAERLWQMVSTLVTYLTFDTAFGKILNSFCNSSKSRSLEYTCRTLWGICGYFPFAASIRNASTSFSICMAGWSNLLSNSDKIWSRTSKYCTRK